VQANGQPAKPSLWLRNTKQPEVAIVTKETPNAKRLKEEKRLEDFTELGLVFNEDRNAMKEPMGRKLARMVGQDDGGYGTSRSAGARYAAGKAQDKVWRAGDKTVGESADDPTVRQARKEAAAEERREARGMKKGGVVSASKRADGCAQRGKTKGRMV
jgi:hypothetical protein